MAYIPAPLRREVVERAHHCCEYCLLSQDDIFFSFEVDHIIAEKHEGDTISDNLCLSCPDCNRYKGSDVASYDKETGVLTSLFNPRLQSWEDHFNLAGAMIESLTAIGRVTVRVLRLNDLARIQDREIYAQSGNYPCKKVNDNGE